MVCQVSRQAIFGERLDHQAIRQRRAPPTNPSPWKKSKKSEVKKVKTWRKWKTKSGVTRKGDHTSRHFLLSFSLFVLTWGKCSFQAPRSMRCNRNKTGSVVAAVSIYPPHIIPMVPGTFRTHSACSLKRGNMFLEKFHSGECNQNNPILSECSQKSQNLI